MTATATTTTTALTQNPAYVGDRPDLLELMPENWSQALDVGCATGALARAMRERNPGGEITGIEIDEAMAAAAAESLDRILCVDALTALDRLVAEGATFDLVCCGDVLEHLLDPWQALRQIRRLCPAGQVLVSLPNVGHWTTLFGLGLLGYWPYRRRGIHDRGHLRFFGRRNLKELFEGAGFEIVRVWERHRLLEKPCRTNLVLEPILRHLPILRRFTAYQFLCVLE